MNEGRDFFEQLHAGMGSHGYDKWMMCMCGTHLNPMDRLFFERTCKRHLKFIRCVLSPYKGDVGFLFTESLTSISMLEYAYKNELFLRFSSVWSYGWNFSPWEGMPEKNALQMILWLKDHNLLLMHNAFEQIVRLDFKDCVEYAFHNKWYVHKSDWGIPVRSVKSRSTLDLFVKHKLFPDKHVVKHLYVYFENPIIAYYILQEQQQLVWQHIDLAPPNTERLLRHLCGCKISRDAHLMHLLVNLIMECPLHSEVDHHLGNIDCAGLPLEITRGFSHYLCKCKNPENHRFSSKRIKLSL